MNSPLRTTFFEFDLATNKKVVSCEINGWMETHAKPRVAVPPPASRFIKNVKIVRASSERTSISKLKEMKSSLLKNTMRKFSERTPSTAESNAPFTASVDNSHHFQSERMHSQAKHGLQLRIVEVSEFKAEEQSMPQMAERKASLLRLRAMAKKGAKPSINHLLLGKEAEIIQNKVTDRQYCGLKFATRRLSSKFRQWIICTFLPEF